jgi:hypothetical protein
MTSAEESVYISKRRAMREIIRKCLGLIIIIV